MTNTREPRGCLATLAVLVIMIGILVGGVAADGAIADQPPRRIEVSDGVTITPPPDWEFGGRSDDERTILLSRGNGSLAITVGSGTDVLSALNALRDEWLARGKVTAVEVGPVASVRPGATAYGFGYSGTFPDDAAPVEGEVTGFAGTSVTVVFDGWTGFGDYRDVRDEVNEIVRATVIP
jgi:hypothetical protein